MPPRKGFNQALQQHVGPIEWDSVVLCGQYGPDRAGVR